MFYPFWIILIHFDLMLYWREAGMKQIWDDQLVITKSKNILENRNETTEEAGTQLEPHNCKQIKLDSSAR